MTDTKTDNTALTDLIQLPDGNWIDPARVIEVATVPAKGGALERKSHRVRIGISGDRFFFAEFHSANTATEFRDDLARKVNEAKAAIRMQGAQSAPLGGVGGGGGSQVTMSGQPVTYESSGGGGGGDGTGWPWHGIFPKAPGAGVRHDRLEARRNCAA